MKKVFGYVRVSTVRQGNGASLPEQRAAIERYAASNNLEIIEWFEEKKTAAKQGRPLFSAMIKKLLKGAASGVIIHKIDRSARNLSDWNEIVNLKERGIEVYFAHESLDLNGRSGRLTADILAVIASDFIRNQRQEVIKGMYGRLNQGIYPWPAPIGYQNTGKGKLKTIDPIQGPLVVKAFEMYATRKYSLPRLLPIMTNLGLRSMEGNRLHINGLSLMLKNTFYIGIMKVKGQVFKGNHEPLIPQLPFKRVQNVFESRTNEKIRRHCMTYSKKIKCTLCGYKLIGELQKGNVYYRCHTKGCETNGIRETKLDTVLEEIFTAIQLDENENEGLMQILQQYSSVWSQKKEELVRSTELQLSQVKAKLDRLTDAFIDQMLDVNTFATKKEQYLKELLLLETQLNKIRSNTDGILTKVTNFLELGKSLIKSFKMSLAEEKSNLIETVTSNFMVRGKELEIPIYFPFCDIIFDKSSFYVHRTETAIEPASWQLSEPRADGSRCVTINLSDKVSRLKKRKRMKGKEMCLFFNRLIEHYQKEAPD